MFDAYAQLPQWIGLVAVLLAGAAAGWFGWQAGGSTPRRKSEPVAA